LPTLIEAMGSLAARHPHAVAIIVGDGPLRTELSRQVESMGLIGCVRLIGFRSDIPAILAASDVFCLPSYMEGLPNVLLEAASAGLPVVASRVGGITEVVLDGVTGLLVPPGSAEALAGALDRMLGDPVAADRLAQAGRLRVERYFSAETVADNYAALYERLMCGRAIRD
jgi:glycosyltransferase involved in cell wall biosynthesis